MRTRYYRPPGIDIDLERLREVIAEAAAADARREAKNLRLILAAQGGSPSDAVLAGSSEAILAERNALVTRRASTRERRQATEESEEATSKALAVLDARLASARAREEEQDARDISLIEVRRSCIRYVLQRGHMPPEIQPYVTENGEAI